MLSSKELAKAYPRVFLKYNLLRLCRGCIRQFKIPQDELDKLGWNITHGVCNRHFVDILAHAGFPHEEIKVYVKQAKAGTERLGSTPTVDFKREYRDLLGWLKNPTPPEK